MSIFFLKATNISRGKGKSAVATAAYQSGKKLYNELDGITHDCSYKRTEVLYHKLYLPKQAPPIHDNIEVLWNHIQKCCIKKNSRARYAKQFIVALQKELNLSDSIAAVDQFVDNFVSLGYAAQANIHNKPDNPHAHILIAARPYKGDGTINMSALQIKQPVLLTDKNNKYIPEYNNDGTPRMDDHGNPIYLKKPLLDANGKQKYAVRKGKGKEALWCSMNIKSNPLDDKSQLKLWKYKWAEICNKLLEQQHYIKIDPELYNRIYRNGLIYQPIPHIHLGPESFALLKKGVNTNLSDDELAITQHNASCFVKMSISRSDWYNPEWSPALEAYKPQYLNEHLIELVKKRIAWISKKSDGRYNYYPTNEIECKSSTLKKVLTRTQKINEEKYLNLLLTGSIAPIQTPQQKEHTDIKKILGLLTSLNNQVERQLNLNKSYIDLYNNIYANKEIRNFMAMDFVTRGRVKKLKKAKNKLESYISKKKHLKNENRLTPNEEDRLNLLIRSTQEQIKDLEEQILNIKSKPIAKKRYDYFIARLKKSMTNAREKATQKYEEAKIFKLLRKETQELKSNINSTNEQIPEPKILKLIQEINIKEPQKAIEKIIQIKNIIPEEFKKRKEQIQNQNIKNEEHKKVIQRQNKER